MPPKSGSIFLNKTDDELRTAFAALTSRQEVAVLLDVPDHHLIYWLYRGGAKYTDFQIPKRRPGSAPREISAPDSGIKIVQQRLNQVLQAVYKPKAPVHGFVRKRGILTNAERHLRTRVLFNIDLQDFFPSIHIGRVQGVFQAAPYNLPASVAKVFAKICCHPVTLTLPQGAPTSPIVSNLICTTLDSGLRKLAENHGCTYTRYADDITFSTTRRALPSQIATPTAGPGGSTLWVVGTAVQQVIDGNTFKVNSAKVRHRAAGQRHEVTGLIVGKGVNVPRGYVRSLRGLLHAWEKHGEKAAETELNRRHQSKHRRPGSPPLRIRDVAAGKLEYLRMVRGANDYLYVKLWNRFSKAAGKGYFKTAVVATVEQVDSALWHLESQHPTDPTQVIQGTAFHLEGYGLVSCAHCLGADPITAFQTGGLVIQKQVVTVTHRDDHHDLARMKFTSVPVMALALGDSTKVKTGDATLAAGFGNYAPGATSRILRGHVTGTGVRHGTPVIFSDHRAFGGHSGGPVLNGDLKVVGVLQRAVSDEAPNQETTVLPVSLLPTLPAVPVAAAPTTTAP